MLMSTNQPQPPTIGAIASVLSMDRTTITAALKPLERRRLVTVMVDGDDRRSRRVKLTSAGKALLARAVPVWQRTHGEIDRLLPDADAGRLRRDLAALT
jgi:DNA-binding MarR family transcriptional regulator